MPLPIAVRLQPSRHLAMMLVAIHAGALLVVNSLELPAWIKLTLLVVVAISAWTCSKSWYGAERIIRLTLREKGVLEYLRFNGEIGDASVDRQSTVTPKLTVILLRRETRREALVLLPDAVNRDDYRRLRVWLRWQS